MSQGTRHGLKIVLDGLHFLNSYWMFYGVNVEILNCHAVSMVLELKNLKHAIIQNCTFGNWTFIEVQNAFIKNCNIVFHEDVSTSLKFLNSSVFMENMTIESEFITRDNNGIFLYNHSLLHIEQSKFINNTAKRGIIKVLESSSLIMSNCAVLGNYGTEYSAVIFAMESFVYLKNTNVNSNMAVNGGGAIVIENISLLQINNCTFKNNSVDRAIGVGGAILSLNNSSLNISFSIFEYNKGSDGGAIYQERSKTKLNQCSFFGNTESAVTGVYGSNVYIMNSIFKKNFAKNIGGAVALARNSVLCVLNTTFKNNVHKSASISITTGGGGAIYLSNSAGNISKSTFENNVAVVVAIRSNNCSLNIEDSKFENNCVLNKEIGQGGCLFLYGNVTIKISKF